MESHLVRLRSRSILLHSRIQNELDMLSFPWISCFSTEQLYQEQKLFLHFSKLLNMPGFFRWAEKLG